MESSFGDALRQVIHDTGIPQELILETVEKALLAAYKKKYHTDINAVARIDESAGNVHLYSKKEIVAEVENDVFDIDLDTAHGLNPEAEIGDEILIELDPIKEFGRIATQMARQIITQKLRDIEKNIIYNEFIARKGELINGYYQRERNGTIYVNLGKAEGILPRNHQSPRENFRTGDRLKGYLYDVLDEGVRVPKIIISRAVPEFVKKLFELEVPEIYDNIVQIKGIVREPGFRTKIAVFSPKDEIDPVGACVGMKGIRIQTIIRELDGEKIDILKYRDDIREYIKNAMSPAKILRVLLLSEEKKEAMVVVPDSDTQLSLAIGKKGLNVRLASRLTGWNIEIKTDADFDSEEYVEESVKKAQDLFSLPEEQEELVEFSEIPGFTPEIIKVIVDNGIKSIQDLIELSEDALKGLEGMSDEMAADILKMISENVEVIDEDVYGAEGESAGVSKEVEEVEEFECGDCGGTVTVDMKVCPHCKVELAFEEE